MLLKFPFSSQYDLLEKLSMCYHFAATIPEAANLRGVLSGVCSVMSRRYFLHINLFYIELWKACSCFCPSGYLLIEKCDKWQNYSQDSIFGKGK